MTDDSFNNGAVFRSSVTSCWLDLLEELLFTWRNVTNLGKNLAVWGNFVLISLFR